MESTNTGLQITPPDKVHEERFFDEEVTSPDPLLLTYQRSRTTPKISLTDVTEENDKIILEINEIGELENQDQVFYGMLPAGSEEIIVE